MNVFEAIQSFLTDRVDAIPANMYNEWFGSGASGTATEAGDTVAAIRSAIAGGYTLQTFTSSNASWAVPADLADASEAYAIAVGGGGKGMPGTAGTSSPGGIGGSSGGYSAEQIDPSALGATLNVTIGAAASSNGADGGVTSIVDGADTLVQSVVNIGAIGTTQGYVPSNSKPGVGGAGGKSNLGVTGVDGESNAFATGGAGGAPYNSSGSGSGVAGGAGGAGQTSGTPLSGGAGGGGGGGSNASGIGTATGGAGGAGGFPGGGSGGGGGAHGTGEVVGNPGTPGNGFAALLWR